jgi:hypothetical protein
METPWTCGVPAWEFGHPLVGAAARGQMVSPDHCTDINAIVVHGFSSQHDGAIEGFPGQGQIV